MEQVDQVLVEITPCTSAGWKPHNTYAPKMDLARETTKQEALTDAKKAVYTHLVGTASPMRDQE